MTSPASKKRSRQDLLDDDTSNREEDGSLFSRVKKFFSPTKYTNWIQQGISSLVANPNKRARIESGEVTGKEDKEEEAKWGEEEKEEETNTKQEEDDDDDEDGDDNDDEDSDDNGDDGGDDDDDDDDNDGVQKYRGVIYKVNNSYQVKVNPGQRYVRSFNDNKKAKVALNAMEECLNERGYSFEKAKEEAIDKALHVEAVEEDDGSEEGKEENTSEDAEDDDDDEEDRVFGVVYRTNDRFQVRVNPGQHYVANFRSRSDADLAAETVEKCLNDKGYTFENAKKAAKEAVKNQQSK